MLRSAVFGEMMFSPRRGEQTDAIPLPFSEARLSVYKTMVIGLVYRGRAREGDIRPMVVFATPYRAARYAPISSRPPIIAPADNTNAN